MINIKNRNHCYYHKVFFKKFHVNTIKMLYYDRIDLSEGINVNKTSASNECHISHYWHFLDEGSSFNQVFAMGVKIY